MVAHLQPLCVCGLNTYQIFEMTPRLFGDAHTHRGVFGRPCVTYWFPTGMRSSMQPGHFKEKQQWLNSLKARAKTPNKHWRYNELQHLSKHLLILSFSFVLFIKHISCTSQTPMCKVYKVYKCKPYKLHEHTHTHTNFELRAVDGVFVMSMSLI